MKNILLVCFITIFFTACSSTTQNKISEHSTYKNNQNFGYQNANVKSESFFDNFKSSQKIALLFCSKKIGHYGINASNTASAYMLVTKDKFHIEVIDIEDEGIESIQNGLKTISKLGITKVISLITNEGYDNFISQDTLNSFEFFMPLVHTNNVITKKENIIYGGVDYQKQFESLLAYSNGKNIEFFDNTLFGDTLNKQLNKTTSNILFASQINDFTGEYQTLLEDNKAKLNDSTLFLNTPIVKTSILLSQIQANDVTPKRILSTQINYTPLILKLTQTQDRKDLIIANSITKIDPRLRETITVLNGDIEYDWLNYATLIGIDYLVSDSKSLVPEIKENQVQYPVTLYRVKNNSFQKIK
jgi:hypothetical protein